jgi:hypothetical protein
VKDDDRGVAEELIELWHCRYAAKCRRWLCRVPATVIARYLDGQGQQLRQIELCERHERELAKGKIAVRDMR